VIFKTLRHLNDRKRANQAAGTDQPFLMVTSFIHPHDPYEPPKANWDRFAEVDIPDPAHPEVPDAAVDPHSHRLRTMCGFDQREPGIEDVRRARRAYYAAVNYIDDHVGAIRQRLEELDLLKNTVIIVTSDHGDMLGEKGLWFKMSPYEQSSRVPIIVNGPAEVVTPGRYARTRQPRRPCAHSARDRPRCRDAQAAMRCPRRARPTSAVGSGPPRRWTTASWERHCLSRLGGKPSGNSALRTETSSSSTSPRALTARRSHSYAGTASSPSVRVIRAALRPRRGSRTSWPIVPTTPRMRRRGRRCGQSSNPDTTSITSRIMCSARSRSRQLVADALKVGTVRHWDFDPEPNHGYVRGDFWSAFRFGRSPPSKAERSPLRCCRLTTGIVTGRWDVRIGPPAGDNSSSLGRVVPGHTLRIEWHHLKQEDVMTKFEWTSEVPLSAETTYDWHAQPGALTRLSPHWAQEIVEESYPPISPGSVAQVRTSVPAATDWSDVPSARCTRRGRRGSPSSTSSRRAR
jgi:choline-sulfatase